jgi:hypothetical protein
MGCSLPYCSVLGSQSAMSFKVPLNQSNLLNLSQDNKTDIKKNVERFPGNIRVGSNQCSGSMTFWCGSGSADPCL